MLCIAAGIGSGIAILLQIDSFKLIADLFPKEALKLLSTPLVHWGGMFLTGLAASAGSSFWHDQLAKVRAIKNSVGK